MDAIRMTPPSPPALSPLPAPVQEPEGPSLKKAATDFAAIFYQKLLKHAWKGRGLLSGGPEARTFYDQLSWEYARVLVQRNERGVAHMIMKSLQPRNRTSSATAQSDTAAGRPAVPPPERKEETR
jgi:hypothetical protein